MPADGARACRASCELGRRTVRACRRPWRAGSASARGLDHDDQRGRGLYTCVRRPWRQARPAHVGVLRPRSYEQDQPAREQRPRVAGIRSSHPRSLIKVAASFTLDGKVLDFTSQISICLAKTSIRLVGFLLFGWPWSRFILRGAQFLLCGMDGRFHFLPGVGLQTEVDPALVEGSERWSSAAAA